MSRIYLSPPDVGQSERDALLRAFDSGWIAPLGPEVDAFERELALEVNVGHAAALSSGTAGLHLALRFFGVSPGDSVIVPTLTFVATANAVTYLGAEPVFVDSNEATWTLDPELLREALADAARKNRLPRAVIAVDLYGQCADYERLQEVCTEYGVPILQDAAEALGAEHRGRPAGGQGRAAVFSFNGNKVITTSGGGMLVSDDAVLIEAARHLASQAREPVPHYEHKTIGYNYRLSNLLAALGRAQLGGLRRKVEQRRRNFEFYAQALGTLGWISFMPEASYGKSSRWLSCVLIDETADSSPEALRLTLERRDIEARPLWKPMHLQPAFASCPCYGGSVAERLFVHGLCLPSGSNLTNRDLERVVDGILESAKGRGRA